nr:hypothetical protein [Carbonactinospora thermoautotrophica]
MSRHTCSPALVACRQNPNGPAIAAAVTCPVSVAVSDANAATRCRRVPRLCRASTLCTPDAERCTPRAASRATSCRAPRVGCATASARISETSSGVIAFGWVGRRRGLGTSADSPYRRALASHR